MWTEAQSFEIGERRFIPDIGYPTVTLTREQMLELYPERMQSRGSITVTRVSCADGTFTVAGPDVADRCASGPHANHCSHAALMLGYATGSGSIK